MNRFFALSAFVICSFVLLPVAVLAQDATTFSNGPNEIKINAVYVIAGAAEFSYERLLNQESAVGISVLASYDDDFWWRGGVLPYYRWYYYNKQASGFFMEANGGVFWENHQIYDFQFEVESVETYFGAGLGFAVGYKFLSERGWVGEWYGGVGRNFVEDIYTSQVYPRFGFNIGRRFGN